MTTAEDVHSSYDEPIGTGGNREDLSDILWDISPTETPGIQALGKGKATAVYHEHLTDALEPVGDNQNIEGSDAVLVKAASRIRMGNYTQIFRKNASVSGTQEKVLKGGGIKSEMAYQVGRRMKAIKRDAEHNVFGRNNAKEAGTDLAAREMGSFSAYMGDENGAIALPGSSYNTGDGSAAAGDGTDTPTAGTPRALSETVLKDALEQLWVQSGGNENIIALCNAHQRGLLSEMTAAGATRYVTSEDKRLVDSIDVYDGDYHTVTITPDRFCLDDAVFLIDGEYAKICDMRPIHSYDLAKLGDSYRKDIVWEFTLEVSNPRAHVMIGGLSTS